MPAQVTVVEAVNRLCTTVCWLEGDRLGSWDNNVRLAEALSGRGVTLTHSYLSRLRQNKLDLPPRVNLIWELCDLMTTSTQSRATITPNYFYAAATHAEINVLLDEERDRLLAALSRERQRAGGQRQRRGHA